MCELGTLLPLKICCAYHLYKALCGRVGDVAKGGMESAAHTVCFLVEMGR